MTGVMIHDSPLGLFIFQLDEGVSCQLGQMWTTTVLFLKQMLRLRIHGKVLTQKITS